MNGTRRSEDRSRAQTTLDFAIAMGVFLLAIAFVFSFIPSLTAPFVDGDQELSAATDRTASHLAEGALGDVDDPYVVREDCMSAFFDNQSAPDRCGFSGDDTRAHLGLSDRHHVEVEIVRVDDGEQHELCLNADGQVSHEGNEDCDGLYYNESTAEPTTVRESITVSRRTVTVAETDCALTEGAGAEACDATLYVRMW